MIMPTSRYNPFTYILKDFSRTFIDHRYDDKRIDKRSLAFFWIVPLLLASAAIIFKLALTINLINVLLIALSVFAALLFNILLLIYDVSHKSKNSHKDKEDSKDPVDPKILQTYVRDTFTAISFSVLISIIAIVFLIIASIGVAYPLFILVISFIVYYLVTVFVMSLFIDLRRIYVLLQYEINNKQ